jgi:alpha-beta hydrolase superfamily lysophospholipase
VAIGSTTSVRAAVLFEGESGSQYFYEQAGSTDKTLKLYEGHYHDLLNDLDKDVDPALGGDTHPAA